MHSISKELVLFVPAALAGRVSEPVLSRAFGLPVRVVSLAGDATPRLAACVDAIGSEFSLTLRQCDVLSGLLVGDSNLEISDTLGIALGTVKTHVEAVLERTGARNRQGLGRLVFGDGTPR